MSVKRSLSASLCAFLLIATSALANAATPGPQTIPGLGTTTFATSTKSPEAQAAFMRGFLLLHLFEYESAAASFISAEKLDPAFAMAYWGEAMTFNHGVWNQVNPIAGKAALDKFAPSPEARAALIADPRERAYIAAVELLYDGTGTKVERDLRYAAAMQGLSTVYPADRNAQLFYALALLSQSESVRDVPVYLHAAEISKTIFRLEPNNPGAAHYWIHGMDDPSHAAGALEAARALSKIAPDAPHAQHMCSHIFIALGMWDDVVQSNVEAIRVGALIDSAAGLPAINCGHYSEWLEYGYFQQGRFHAAQQAAADCQRSDTENVAWATAHGRNPARPHHRLANAYTIMHNTDVIESHDWTATEDAAWDTTVLDPDKAAWHNFIAGFADAQRGDLPAANAALQAMRTQADTFRSVRDAEPQDVQAFAVSLDELNGLIQIKAGQYEAGVATLRHAVETYRGMAFAFGPPVTVKPPEELLGEVQLEKGDAAAARLSFEQSLERAPRRTQSLLGLARAEHRAGDEVSSRQNYQTLLTIWHTADPNLPGLEEAHKALAEPAINK
jgi:tetratricopeptide (TPR) repeat protein